MVQAAQGSKAPVQRIVDKISGIFVPIVVGLAILTFIVWLVVGGKRVLLVRSLIGGIGIGDRLPLRVGLARQLP